MNSIEIINREFCDSLIMSQDENKTEYKKIVTEGLSFPKVKDKINEILYKDIRETAIMSYPEVDKTKGDFTKFKYYKRFSTSIEILQKYYNGKYPEDLKTLMKVHSMLINERQTFEHGYRYGVEILSQIYTALFLGAYELLSLCIAEYLNTISAEVITDKSNLVLTKSMKKLVACYDSGEWSNVMRQFKKEGSNLFGEIVYGGILAAGLYLSLRAIFAAIRELIYLFYQKSFSLNSSLKSMSTFLEAAIKEEKAGSTAMKREQTLNKSLVGLSNFIESHIIKEDNDAKKALDISNKTKYSKKSITAEPEIMKQNKITAEEPKSDDGVLLF